MTNSLRQGATKLGINLRAMGSALALAFSLGFVVSSFLSSAQAETFTVLYTFTGYEDADPYAGLISDAQGNLYGAASGDGKAGACGLLFKLDKAGKETVLYTFADSGVDGCSPMGTLTRDKGGNFYGTTSVGGVYNNGVVFELDTTGKLTVLYSFQFGPGGSNPIAGVIRDSSGNLYGTALNGGITACDINLIGCGVVFKLDTAGHETVLHTFAGTDGRHPWGPLATDGGGNLYGTTFAGGSGCGHQQGCGTVFKIDKQGRFRVLHRFAGGNKDGAGPRDGVVLQADGTLFGTTYSGGRGNCPGGCGTVFKLDAKGREAVLHSFTTTPRYGRHPYGGLTLDTAGNLYGTALRGEAFKLNQAGKTTILVNNTGGGDFAALLRDNAGTLYGTTSGGGNCSPPLCGTVFKITP